MDILELDSAFFLSLEQQPDNILVFSGSASSDAILGSQDSDVLVGFSGSDTLQALSGDDWLNGNADNDWLNGNLGEDTIYGGQGTDTIYGGKSQDILSGNQEKDWLSGNREQDTIYGGEDDDIIYGGQENDLLHGGSGADTLLGDAGIDSLTGGDGLDVFMVGQSVESSTSTAADMIMDFQPGEDLIDLVEGLTPIDLSLEDTGSGDVAIRIGATGETLAVVRGIDTETFDLRSFVNGAEALEENTSEPLPISDSEPEPEPVPTPAPAPAPEVPPEPIEAPAPITLNLANDTGDRGDDRVTSDPTITGTIPNQGTIQSFRAGFDDTPVEEFVDISASLQEDGSFELNRERLEEIKGETLENGEYTLKLQIIDAATSEPEILELGFVLAEDNPPNNDTPPNTDGPDFADKVVEIARGEWEFFNQGSLKEGEDGAWQKVTEYWQVVDRPDVDTSEEVSSDENPWSAAFISWVMNQAGAGDQFEYSASHSNYITDAIQDRETNDGIAAFFGYRLDEYSPKPGDLVGYARQDGVGYDTPAPYQSHTDIVVAVRDGEIDVIGGNVSDSVTLKTLKTDAEGRLIDTSEDWFVVLSNQLSDGNTVTPPSDDAGEPPYPGYLFTYEPGETLTYDANVELWQQQMKDLGFDIDVDGLYGPESESVARQFQESKGLDVDGVVGPDTWEASFGTDSVEPPSEPPVDSGDVPPYPGYLLTYEPGETLSYDANVELWQQQMKDLGFEIDVDGLYGPQSEAIARQFQESKGLDVDGVVGPDTWDASFGTDSVDIPPDENPGTLPGEVTPDPLYPNYSGEITVNDDLSPNIRAFLDTIAHAEGTYDPEGYRIMFGGNRFDSFGAHPNVRVPFGDTYSTAAGRYQFLNSTWDDLVSALGLSDFSPENQDLAAVQLIKGEGAFEDVEAGKFEEAAGKVANIWASFPGAGYGQPEKNLQELKQFYETTLQRYV
ncbi:MAG: DUF2272 domain-containing protein [Microcoleaceae cyanobacterium]